MKHFNEYKRVVAIKEKSSGNATVGDMWIETSTFDKNAKISEIIDWAKDASGKLVITIDENEAEDKYNLSF